MDYSKIFFPSKQHELGILGHVLGTADTRVNYQRKRHHRFLAIQVFHNRQEDADEALTYHRSLSRDLAISSI